MCARIFKKRAPSRKFFASMISIMVSFAVSSALGCMEVVLTEDVTEKSPLVQAENPLAQDGNNDECISIDQLPEIKYDPELLIEFDDPEPKAQEMNKISIYLQYIEAKYIKKDEMIIRQINEYGRQREIFKEQPQEFERVLFDEALEVDSQEIIPTYLEKVYKKGVGNQKLSIKLLEYSKLARERFVTLLEKYNTQENKIKRYENEINQLCYFYAPAIAAIAFGLGITVGITIMQWWRCP